MKDLTKALLLIVFVYIAGVGFAVGQESNEENKIRDSIHLYEKALNNNSVEGISKIFTEDGIVILQGSPTVIGTDAIQQFYIKLFKTVDFGLIFNIDEVVQMSPKWAFVRTSTTGTNKVLSNDSSRAGNGHEIFILKKQTDGNWKIARYAGSSVKS